MNGIRAFIAIELAPNLRAELVRLQVAIKLTTHCPAKWVALENLHLTLCFLGEIAPLQVETVKNIMSKVGESFAPLQLETSLLGTFPDSMQPQTIWVGLGGNLVSLSELHRCLEIDLRVIGYLPEGRPFRPHLTIARVRQDAIPVARRELKEALSRLKAPLVQEAVSGISLMQSTLSPSGAIYNRLCHARLSGGLSL